MKKLMFALFCIALITVVTVNAQTKKQVQKSPAVVVETENFSLIGKKYMYLQTAMRMSNPLHGIVEFKDSTTYTMKYYYSTTTVEGSYKIHIKGKYVTLVLLEKGKKIQFQEFFDGVILEKEGVVFFGKNEEHQNSELVIMN